MSVMADDFSREVTRQAIARASLALDFKEADEEVLDCLADVVHHYIETIGEVTQENAECSGRQYPGVQDVIGALENKRSTTKTNWRELSAFAFGKSDQSVVSSSSQSLVWSQPFPFPVSTFPFAPPTSTHASFGNKVTSLEQPPPSHFPVHFPPFPPSYTYKKTTTSDSSKRTAEGPPDEAQQRAKKLQVAKGMQKSITALEEILVKDTDSSAGTRTPLGVATTKGNGSCSVQSGSSS